MNLPRTISLTDPELASMLFWHNIYEGEVARIINVLTYWKENPL